MDSPPLSRLEEALRLAARSDRESAVLRLNAALRGAELFLPQAEAPAWEGERVTAADETLRLFIVAGEDGPLLPVYSSLGRLQEAAPHAQGYVALEAAQVARLIDDGRSSLGLDFGLPWAMQLAPGGVEMLATTGLHEEAFEAGTALVIGHPEEEPEPLLDAVRRHAAERPAVLAAYHALVSVGGAMPEFAVGLRVRTQADVDPERDELARLPTGVARFVAIVFAAPDDPIADWMVEEAAPFWSRAG